MKHDITPRQAATRVLAKAATRAMTIWGFSPDRIAALAGVDLSDIAPMRAGEWVGDLEPGTEQDLVDVVRIHVLLDRLFSGQVGQAWMTRANTGEIFEGQLPVALIERDGSEGLKRILGHLRALAQGY